MTQRNIVLIGFMGSGKSMTSKSLGQLLKRPVFSTDAIIEKKEGKSIPEIFAKKGEAYFRNLERVVVDELAGKQGVIIDCGGGVVLNPTSMTRLKKNGAVFFLHASAESVYAQIKHDKNRPLVNVVNPLERIRQLMEDRQPLYEQADYIINADFKTIEEITKSVMEVLNDVE